MRARFFAQSSEQQKLDYNTFQVGTLDLKPSTLSVPEIWQPSTCLQ